MRDEARRGGLVRRLLELARDEDLGTSGDVTSAASIAAGRTGRYQVVPRQAATLAGLAFLPDLVEVFGAPLRAELHAEDGDAVRPGVAVATLEGSVRGILAVERTLLNLVCRLSGIATRTRAFVEAMGGGGKAELCDTRKTTPGLRVFEKYAVRCGGGCSHRMGLYDAVLVKDNHLAGVATAGLAEAVRGTIARARELRPSGLAFIEVEVDRLEQLAALLAARVEGLGLVLLDNMGVEELREAVRMRDASGVRVGLEASGGVSLSTVGAIAGTGVDRISVGSLTHGATSVDFGLDACA